jgi:hypothetical protein
MHLFIYFVFFVPLLGLPTLTTPFPYLDTYSRKFGQQQHTHLHNVALLNFRFNYIETKQGSYIQVSQDMKSLSIPFIDLLVNIPSYSIHTLPLRGTPHLASFSS